MAGGVTHDNPGCCEMIEFFRAGAFVLMAVTVVAGAVVVIVFG